MKKRLLSWLMVCAMLVSLLPVIATAEDAVAFVGEDGYATLAEAVEAAGAGDTITLKGDVEITEPITVDKDLTIEADGDRTIYQAANIASLFTINGGAVATTITVAFSAPDGHYLTFSGKNGGTQYTASSAMLYIRYANVTGTNLKFVDGNGGSNAAAVNIAAGSFTMNNCHIQRCTSASTSYGGVMYVTYANKTSGVVTMNGGSVTDCSSSSGLSLVQVAQGGSGAYAGIFNGNGTTFSHNTVTGGPLIKVNGKVALDGCSFSENTASYAVLTGNTYFAAGRTVANCTFDTEQEDTLSGNITATDNTFPVPETVVAKIGEQGFSTLAGAVAAASAGDVITLVDDAELSARLTIDKALTIETDGVADRTIRAADAINQHMIYVGGSAKSAFTMTFRGSEGSRLIIDADGNAARAALCVEKADAVLSCVNIINGSSTSGSHCGGLYVTNGVVTADHVILQNNQTTATGGYGGAVHITATGGLFMTNCAVTGNTAVNETAKGSDGHSIIRVNGDFSATDCVFTNNTVFINDGSTYYTSDPGTLRTNGYIISAANDTDTYTRLIQNCVFDTTEKTAVDVTNGMVWVLRGNIYADAGRTSGSQTMLATLPDLAVMDGEAVLYGYLTNGSDKTGNSPADGVTEEITWRLSGGDKVTADYAAYTAALVSAGYTAYTSNTIGANLFGTYTKGDVTVTVAATPGSKTLRVIADTGVTLPAIAPVAAGSATPTVTMLGTGDQEHLKDSNRDKCYGMSFIFRLSDGHFIVVDGGYDDAAEAERLYDKLTELSGGAKPVIDTWILTHSHRDHVGAFTTFAAAYGSNVTLNSVTFNFPNKTSYNENLTNGGPQNTLYRDAVLSASTYFPGATVYKPHPGTVMQFAGTEVEFLYTYELSAPNDLWNFNDSSLVFTVTINGQRIMMTGDCAQPSTEAILANYTVAELECDALQMAHHGYYNNIVQADFYKWAMGDTGSGVTEKKLAFWPGCELYAYTNSGNDPTAAKDAEAAANAYLIAEPNVKIVVAGDRNADPGEYTYEILTTGLKNAGVIATVGDDEFATLADAIAAAEAGGTITLLGDLELDGETFTKNVTLTAGEAVALTGTAAVADGVTVTAGGNVSGGVFELQGSGAVSGASYGSYGTYVTGDGKTYFIELTGTAAVIDETLTAYDTLAEAVAAAEEGQKVVIVADTVVLDGVLTLDKAVTVTTEGDANVTVYASARDSGKFLINITAQNVKLLGKENARLILDGRLNGMDEYEAERGVLGVQGANAEVAYVTVQNGLTNYTSGGGGVYVGKVAELSHCEVRNCAATNKGGAIYVANAGTELTLTDSVLDGNTASGQYGGGALYIVSNAKVMMERCVVSNNTATNTAKQTGGAVFVAQSGSKTAGYLVATDTEFTGNSTNAVEGAGAIVFTGVISLERCTFSGNDSNVPILLAGNTNASYTCNSAAVSRRITDTTFDAVKSEAISGGGSTIALTDNVYKTDVSVTLAADLGLNFYVTSDAADAVMTFTVDGVDTVAPLDEANGRYTARLTAKEMNKTVTATLSHGEKTLYTVDYSVEEYLNQLAAEGSGQTAAVKAAAEAVKHYGEAAALYFDPSLTSVTAAELAANLPSLTAEGVTSYYEADEDKVTTAEGISFYGKSLLCKDTTLLRLYFTADAAPAVTVAYGETAVDVTVTAHADGQHYYVDIPVAAARLSGSFAVTATLGESTLSFDMGVYDYIRQALTLYADNAEKTPLTNMCKALWQYSESVKTLG